MSNDVYGYVEATKENSQVEVQERLEACADQLGIGISRISAREVYGLPSQNAPSDDKVCFRISDTPDGSSASYLIDMVDYAPDAKIGLPLVGSDRLERLLDWIAAILSSSEIRRVVIAMSDENEVEGAVEISSSDFRRRLIADFEDYAPPNKVYVVEEPEG